MLLYRGTKPSSFNGYDALFRTEGILVRVMDGGDPTYVEDVGTLRAVQEHVGKEPYSKRSSYVSFSASHEVALRYAWNALDGVPVRRAWHEYAERAIVFRLDAAAMEPEADQGVFQLEYRCDHGLARPNLPTEDEAGSAEAISCEFCIHGPKMHVLRLINVRLYLAAHGDLKPDPKVAQQATDDKEWLAYPMDYIPRLRGFGSRIPLSSIWTAELYS